MYNAAREKPRCNIAVDDFKRKRGKRGGGAPAEPLLGTILLLTILLHHMLDSNSLSSLFSKFLVYSVFSCDCHFVVLICVQVHAPLRASPLWRSGD